MGMDLTSDSGAEFRFTGMGWNFCLRLAEAYGWRGQRTLPPAGVAVEAWSGTYDSNEGQRVKPEDADSLATVLKLALVDPHRSRIERQVADEMSRLLTQHFGRPVPVEPSMTEAHYQEFVAFCKEGGFRID